MFIVCDTGEHYLTKFHSDEWMKEKLLLEPQKITAGLIAETKSSSSPHNLVFISPDEIVREALSKMNENSVTQIPVLDKQKSVGSLKESSILAKLLENKNTFEVKVSEIMDQSFPVLNVDSSFEEIKANLRKAPAVLVEDFKRITSIITRTDLLDIK